MTTANPPQRDVNAGLVRPFGVVLAVLLLGALIASSRRLQIFEAVAAANGDRHVGLSDVHRLGTVITFSSGSVATGYDVTLGCSVTFLLIPFVAITAGLLVIRRVPVWRATAALVTAILLIALFNQLRLVSIGVGMSTLGPRLGYSLTHVFIGTLISTLGISAAGAAYLAILLRRPRTPGAHRG